jgi:hypothetical protein
MDATSNSTFGGVACPNAKVAANNPIAIAQSAFIFPSFNNGDSIDHTAALAECGTATETQKSCVAAGRHTLNSRICDVPIRRE